MIPYRVYDQINIGPITIYTWGFFVGLGFVVGLVYALKEARKRGIDQKKVLNLAIFIFIGVVLGARLGYVLQFFGYYFGRPAEIFKLWDGGMMFYGGFVGAVLLGIFYLIFHGRKKEILLTADILAPGIALGLAIGRIGCILINEHQGALTSLPWAILWPDGTLRHPVAIYLSLNAFVLFLILRHIKNRPEKHELIQNGPDIATPTFLILPPLAGGGSKEGVVRNPFLVFLLYYSVSRFFLDFTRSQGTYLSDPHFWGLTTSQYISLTIFMVIVIILFRKKLVFNK